MFVGVVALRYQHHEVPQLPQTGKSLQVLAASRPSFCTYLSILLSQTSFPTFIHESIS